MGRRIALATQVDNRHVTAGALSIRKTQHSISKSKSGQQPLKIGWDD
jgi:hypothetical protein